MNHYTLTFHFFKGDKNFPISGVDMPSYYDKNTIDRIIKVIKPLLNQTTDVSLDLACSNRVFLKEIILFCKTEGVDYQSVMSWTVDYQVDKSNNSIIVSVVFGKPSGNGEIYNLTI